MSTLPSNPRIQAIHDVGVKIDDALERAQLDTARREGAHEAYSNIVSTFSSLLDDISSDGSLQEAASKALLNKILTVCKRMEESSSAQLYAARGAEVQTKAIIETVKSMYDVEIATSARAHAHAEIKRQVEPESHPQVEAQVELPADDGHQLQNSKETVVKVESAPSKRPIPALTLKEQRRNAIVSLKSPGTPSQ